MREDLGDGYAETLRAAYPTVPESADFVMYWWHKAAEATCAGRARRFGFITTNSIRQTFNRRIVQAALDKGIYLTFAIPDHPWIDATECAAVRIAMTVGAPKSSVVGPDLGQAEKTTGTRGATKVASSKPEPGRLHAVAAETPDEETGENVVQLALDLGTISADLTTGAAVNAAQPLQANEGLSSPGVKLHGSGFIVTAAEAKTLGLGKVKGLEQHIRPYRNGRDLTDRPRDVMVIDLFGLSADEVRTRFPKVYEHVLRTVKPEREINNRASYRDFWWIHGEPRRDLRPALVGLKRYIATFETGKHRFFQFLEAEILPDNMLIAIALADAFHLGVLSSRIHVVYSLAAGGRLGVGNDPRYNKSRCFDPFPFPDCTETQKERIRKLAEELDAHRKRAQQQHGLGLTDIYNVLEKLRAGTALSTKERALHDAALVSTLKHLHDELDAAVADAYGWPWPLADEEILERVVALNAARADEEAAGTIRWLRPEYQIPRFAKEKSAQTDLPLPGDAKAKPAKKPKAGKPAANVGSNPAAAARPRRKLAWPKTLAERAKAVESALAAEAAPVTPAELATRFARAKPDDVAEILDTLRALGRARSGDRRGTFLR